MKHGLSKNKDFFRLMHILSHMRDRCYNKNCQDFKHYGKRGIKICNEWIDKENGTVNFYNWAIKNGYKKGLTIDRINNDGNYEPENCRWITIGEQQNNKRNNIKIKYKNETHTPTEWAKILNVSVRNIYYRYYQGMSPNMIFEKGNLSNLKQEEILMLDRNWKFLKKFKNVHEIKEAGFNSSHVREVCKGKRNFHKGYRWKFNKEVKDVL